MRVLYAGRNLEIAHSLVLFYFSPLIFAEEQLPLVLEVGCTAAGCQQGPYIPPPPDFNHTQVALIASVTTLCILCLIAAIALSCLYSKRYSFC